MDIGSVAFLPSLFFVGRNGGERSYTPRSGPRASGSAGEDPGHIDVLSEGPCESRTLVVGVCGVQRGDCSPLGS